MSILRTLLIAGAAVSALSVAACNKPAADPATDTKAAEAAASASTATDAASTATTAAADANKAAADAMSAAEAPAAAPAATAEKKTEAAH